MWAAGHDLWSTGYVRRCVEIMEEAPGVVLCSPRKVRIDAEGRVVERIPNRIDSRGMEADVIGRLGLFLFAGPHSYTVYGLIRRDALARTKLFQPIFGPDLILLMELSVLGCVAQVADEEYRGRYNRSTESFDETMERYRIYFFSPEDRPRRWFPLWRYVRESFGVVGLAEGGISQKAALSAVVLLSLWRQRPHILRELVHFGQPSIWKRR